MYKFALVFTSVNDYMRWPDLEAFEINPEEFMFQRNKDGIAFIQEGINRPLTDRVIEILKTKGIEVMVLSRALHNDFADLIPVGLLAQPVSATEVTSASSSA